ncbi:MAG: hypothetical protein RIQ52_104 [Pseudomonadota bacterium]
MDARAIKTLRQDIERELGARDQWDTATCRLLLDALLALSDQRRRSEAHERSWFSLAGWCMRPGFGAGGDHARMQALMGLHDRGLQFVTATPNWAEWWTFWRRISGGLDAGQQERLFHAVMPYLDPVQLKKASQAAQAARRSPDHLVRMVAGLERLDVRQKQQLGEWMIQRLLKASDAPELWWALGRIGARKMLYAQQGQTVEPAVAASWIRLALDQDWKKLPGIGFAVMLMSRMTGEVARDIDDQTRQLVLERLRQVRASSTWTELVSAVTQLDAEEEQRCYGEALPSGLRRIDS